MDEQSIYSKKLYILLVCEYALEKQENRSDFTKKLYEINDRKSTLHMERVFLCYIYRYNTIQNNTVTVYNVKNSIGYIAVGVIMEHIGTVKNKIIKQANCLFKMT